MQMCDAQGWPCCPQHCCSSPFSLNPSALPSSSSSSYWHLPPSQGAAPSFGTPEAQGQCLLHLLSVFILCYTPTALPAEPTLGKE